MGFFGPYKFKNKKTGKEWFLHVKENGKVKLYYFSKVSAGCLNDIPPGYEVSANDRTELPFLRKKAGPAQKKPSGGKQDKSVKEEAPSNSPPA